MGRYGGKNYVQEEEKTEEEALLRI